jgi:DnaK suppressor protein
MPTTTQPRTDLDLKFFRARLSDERKLAEATIAGTQSLDGNDGMNETGTNRAELSNADNHPADMGTELFQREEDMALIQNAREILAQIEQAEAKIAAGTYGISDRSGQPIPKERLEAIPYATLTAEEQGLQELS